MRPDAGSTSLCTSAGTLVNMGSGARKMGGGVFLIIFLLLHSIAFALGVFLLLGISALEVG